MNSRELLAQLSDKLHLVNQPKLRTEHLQSLSQVVDQVAPPNSTSPSLAEVDFRICDLEFFRDCNGKLHLLEVAVWKLQAGKKQRLFATLVKPPTSVPGETLTLTGIDADELERSPVLSDILVELRAALDGDCLVAHDLVHEQRLLDRVFGPQPWQPPATLCTQRLSRHLLTPRSHSSLEQLAAIWSLPHPRHRADADVATTTALLELLLQRAHDDGLHTLAELQARGQRRQHAAAITPLQLESVSETPGTYRFYSATDQLLYVGYTKNLRRRLREHLVTSVTKLAQALRAQAVRFETTVHGSALEAYLEEGEVLKTQTTLLNRRLSERGQSRYLKIGHDGSLTLTPEITDAAIHIGPIVLPQSERRILTALRRQFSLRARQKRGKAATASISALLAFAEGHASTRQLQTSDDDWSALMALQQVLKQCGQERLHESDLLSHPVIVVPMGTPAFWFALFSGRRALRLSVPVDPATIDHSILEDWLEEPAGTDDAITRRIAAFVRAQPDEVVLVDARLPNALSVARDPPARVVHRM